MKEGKLLLDTGGEADELQLIEDLEFYVPRINVWVSFERDASGAVSKIKAYTGEDFEGKKLD
jgi:hypothetical protein